MIKFQSKFSHIYLEKQVEKLPLTKLIISKFSRANIIKIDHYKDIFNRVRQDFQVQKQAMNLILARKTEPLLYPASDMVQDYKNPNSFYNTPILNCLYNCEYCFLQGMYPSGNLVVFTNELDFYNSIDKKLSKLEDPNKPMIVSISYNTDLLAMENIFPMVSRWVKFARARNNLIIEIRTKSSFFNSIKDMKPSKNIILSWTLSPEKICKEYEIGAPPLSKRLDALSDALNKGWRVRLCFDPILLIKNWETIYDQFIDDVFSQIKTDKLRDVTIGVFRMNKDYFNRIRKRGSKSALYYKSYVIEGGTVTLEKNDRQEALNKIERKIGHYLPKDKILMWS
tara:strand:+ start:130 stop:1146 length:1017 start_codon:yes stop_codon:yes gene_type:complete